MAKVASSGGVQRSGELDSLFEQASERYEAGKFAAAFCLFLEGAKRGDTGAQLAVGNSYIDGTGVKKDRQQGLRWYRRAFKQGCGPAASNIGVVYRDENKLKRALSWFERAAKLRDADANLQIAKIYLHRGEAKTALRYLQRAIKAKADDITDASREEAQLLLSKLAKSG